MAALIKELLVDLVYYNLDHISRIDIEYGLTKLYKTNQISALQIRLLDQYLSGYTIIELQVEYPNVAELLVSVLCLLEHEIQYTDESFLQLGLTMYPRYGKIADALRQRLDTHGREL